MSIITKNRMNLAEKAELENAAAKAVRNEDLIEYIAMMTDVEIPMEGEANE